MDSPAVCDQVAGEPVHKQLKQEAFQLANIPAEGTDDSTATIICTAGELATYVCTYAWLKVPRCANSCMPFGTFFCFFCKEKMGSALSTPACLHAFTE